MNFLKLPITFRICNKIFHHTKYRVIHKLLHKKAQSQIFAKVQSRSMALKTTNLGPILLPRLQPSYLSLKKHHHLSVAFAMSVFFSYLAEISLLELDKNSPEVEVSPNFCVFASNNTKEKRITNKPISALQNKLLFLYEMQQG